MQAVITKDDVAKAVADLTEQGKRPSATAIRALLGRGSLSTVIKLKSELEAGASAAKESEEALRMFRSVWDMAFQDGRKHSHDELQTVRDDLLSSAAELARLEGENALAVQQATDAKQQREAALAELALANEQVIAARAANETSANERAALSERIASLHEAHGRVVTELQRKIEASNERAHQLELELARALAVLEAGKSSR